MANCINCGTKLNAFNQAYPLWDDRDRLLCGKCRTRFEKQLTANKVGLKSVRLTHEFIDSIAPALQFTDSGVQYLHDYAQHLIDEADAEKKRQDEEALEEERIRQEEEEINKVLSKILISSGFNFEGYRIVKYSGYISGDDAVQIPRSGLFDRGQNGKNLTDALVRIRRQALKELKQAAYDLGCNAVIGVDFDYITLDPETATLTGGTLYEPYVICVTANGNAVVIEKIED